MTGLRERKKRAARQAILDAASELFVIRGFEETKVDEIAEGAMVSTGTLYKHFPTKAEILQTMFRDDCEVVYEQCVAMSSKIGDRFTVVDFVVDCMRVTFQVTKKREKDLWRQIYGHVMFTHAESLAALVEARKRYENMFTMLFLECRAMRRWSEDRVRTLAQVADIFCVHAFRSWLLDEAPTTAILKRLRTQLDFVFSRQP